jgi:hypothetical protein
MTRVLRNHRCSLSVPNRAPEVGEALPATACRAPVTAAGGMACGDEFGDRQCLAPTARTRIKPVAGRGEAFPVRGCALQHPTPRVKCRGEAFRARVASQREGGPVSGTVDGLVFPGNASPIRPHRRLTSMVGEASATQPRAGVHDCGDASPLPTLRPGARRQARPGGLGMPRPLLPSSPRGAASIESEGPVLQHIDKARADT